MRMNRSDGEDEVEVRSCLFVVEVRYKLNEVTLVVYSGSVLSARPTLLASRCERAAVARYAAALKVYKFKAHFVPDSIQLGSHCLVAAILC